MKNFSLSAYNLSAKIFWTTLALLSLAGGGLTLYVSAQFTSVQFIGLFLSLAVSALVNQHEWTIPSKRLKLHAAEFTVWAGILLLGVPGGVLLAASVAAVHYRFAPENKSRWTFDSLIGIVSAFCAGIVSCLILKTATGLTGQAAAGEEISFGWSVLSIAAAAFVYRSISYALSSILGKFENASPKFVSSPRIKLFQENDVLGAAATLALYFILQQFGLSFGFVILVITVVGHYVYLVHNSRLAQKTREISEASRVHLATVEALATAIDARDQIGTGHVRRTQIYAVGIGKLLGLPADELQALNTAAILHDIGKLAVPDHILNKPGRLTPAEMEKTKIHSTVGASILERVNFAYPVVPTVKYHHEAWDGSGYPEGLRGEEIPLTARILSVADAFDTLRGARPYRPAISRDDARRFIKNGAGTQFDQNVVDVFLRNLQKFEAEVDAQRLSYTLDEKNIIAAMPVIFDRESDQSYVEQIKRANREVYTLYELARVFSSSLNLEETLSLFVQKIGELVPFDTCIVYLMDDSQEYATAAYVQGENKFALEDKRVKMGEGATGYVLKKRQAVYNINPSLDFSLKQPKLSRNYSAMISLPLIGDQKMLGAVSLYSQDLRNYEEEHMRLLETVARIASDAMGMALQHAESESRALTDPMTNLPNARSLQMQFEKEAARADRNGSSFQVLMLDLDGFKAVNDTFGHKAGDRLLKGLAQVMSDQLRDYDFLARYAGDEFVVILPETDSDEINDLCDRIEKAVSKFALPVDEDQFAKVGISIGAACYPQHGSTVDQIVIAADKAMYAVKAERKALRMTEAKTRVGEILETSETGEASLMIGEILENTAEENYILELDESHIVSSAIN